MATDLSLHDGPVSDLFAEASDDSSFRLGEEQLTFYRENGFVGGVPLLNQEQIEALRAELDEFVRPGHDGSDLWYEYHSNESSEPGRVLFHALGAWRLRPAMHDILWSPRFTIAASQLLGGSVRFWHDQLFCKPAGHGGVVAWHQDYSYWTRTKPMGHLTCWIGLDDATTENGCIHYVPGSHRWPLLPTTDLANDLDAIRGVLNEEQLEQFQPVPCQMNAGEAVFHHPLTLHGSHANTSDRPRRAIVLNVFLDGTLSDHDEPLLDGTYPIPAGQPMGGRFHPLLRAVK